MATIHDVARHAAVSVATVSRVLNDRVGVNEEMAARVRASIAELSYRPSHVARSMRTQRTDVIAVVIPDIEDPYYAGVVRGIEKAARAAGRLVVLGNSADDPEAEQRYLTLVGDQRVDGVILLTNQPSVLSGVTGENRIAPLVLIDSEIFGVRADSVSVDSQLGARKATRHLLDQGARSFACLTGPTGEAGAHQHLAGFSGALASQGIHERDITIRHCELTAPDARRAVRDLVTSASPDALLVCDDKLMLGALQGLEAETVAIPQDVLVAGYTDEGFASSWRPTITTVVQHPHEVGRSATQLLIDRIDNPSRSIQRVLIQPTLAIRESSLGSGRVTLAATS